MEWTLSQIFYLGLSFIFRTLCKTAVVPIPTTAHRPFIELPWGDCWAVAEWVELASGKDLNTFKGPNTQVPAELSLSKQSVSQLVCMGNPDPPGPPPGGLCRETSALYGVRWPRITLLRRSVHTLFGTGYTHGASSVNVIFVLCSSVYIYK